MSPSKSVSEATQEQQTIEEAFIAVYVAARTNGKILHSPRRLTGYNV